MTLRVKWTCPACDAMCGDARQLGIHVLQGCHVFSVLSWRGVKIAVGFTGTDRTLDWFATFDELGHWLQSHIESVGFDEVKQHIAVHAIGRL